MTAERGATDAVDAGAEAERGRVLALLRRHGWNATSFQVLEPGFRYWFDGDDACVAYVDTGGAWVGAGAPLCPLGRCAEVAERFIAAARQAGRRACLFATEERFTARSGLASLMIGEQPLWDPAAWDESLRQSRGLREQVRRARAKGVAVRALTAAELGDEASPPRQAMNALIERWLRARPMAPMGFLVQLHLFSHPEERRCFVAEQGGRLVGLLGAVPIYARGGWFLEDLLRDPAAPNGTAELLVDGAMRAAAAEGARCATLGLAPLSGVASGWLRAARQSMAGLYDFEGLRAFKAKLRPRSWAPIYLSYPAAQGVAASTYDVLAAFSREGVLRFGLRTLLRAPSLVVRLLGALLVPWTLLLALVDPARWFPSPWVQRGWVLFDGLLVLGLLSLSRRWRHGLATALAALVSADAALTLGEVILYNAPRARGADWLVLALAVAAPTAAAALLFCGRVHRGILRP